MLPDIQFLIWDFLENPAILALNKVMYQEDQGLRKILVFGSSNPEKLTRMLTRYPNVRTMAFDSVSQNELDMVSSLAPKLETLDLGSSFEINRVPETVKHLSCSIMVSDTPTLEMFQDLTSIQSISLTIMNTGCSCHSLNTSTYDLSQYPITKLCLNTMVSSSDFIWQLNLRHLSCYNIDCSMLPYLPQLEELNLISMSMSDQDWQYLIDLPLKQIMTKVRDTGTWFQTFMQQTDRLHDLAITYGLTDDGCQHLAKSIRKLAINSPAITDQAIIYLNQLPLQKLTLKGQLTDLTLQNFKLTTLTHLELSNQFTHALDNLSKSPIQTLVLRKHRPTDQHLFYISKLPLIRFECQDYTQVTNQGLKYLSRTNIQNLTLKYAIHLTDLTCLKNLPLKQLNLSHGPKITEYIPPVKYLTIAEITNPDILPVTITHLTIHSAVSLSQLNHLSLEYLSIRNIHNQDIQLMNQPNLRTLILETPHLTHQVIPYFIRFPHLEKLHISQSKFQPINFEPLVHSNLPLETLQFETPNRPHKFVCWQWGKQSILDQYNRAQIII